ncbi:MAG: TRAP transporter substrate-binding protein [Deltaproteobacteria bacterium]|nr:TRAP transporter substrate-binding protein [Deltaproteobacteria bacterium]
MKNQVRAIAALCLGAAMLLGTCVTGNAAASKDKPIVMKFGHVMSTDNSWHKGCMKFAEIVREKTGGRIKVQVFPNSQLGDERDMAEGCQMGTIDMVIIGGIMGNFYEPIQLFEIPYFFKDINHVRKVIYVPLGEEIKADIYKQSGLVSLEFWERCPRVLSSNKPVLSVEDVKGLKLRTPEIPATVAAWKAIGANPTPMPWAEVYTALQQKTIDAQENPLATIASAKVEEVQSHIALTNHVFGTPQHIMSGGTWERLSAEDKAVIKEAAKEAREYQNAIAWEEDAATKEVFVKKGVIFTEPDLSGFQERSQSIHGEFAARYGKELYDKVQKAAE